jgi:uncharacterized protein
MHQYLIMAHDPTTPEALAHRMRIRPQHLAFIKSYKDRGEFILGGAHLDADKNMKGSTLILQFETEEGIKTYEQNEPYIREKVWERYEIIPFRVANIS